MELEFESSDTKTTYDKCKYVVKVWEHKFKKDFGRLPSKLDIREASKDVRSAYKTYFHLKTKILEKSFNELEGFDFDDQNEADKAKSGDPDAPPVLKSVSINNKLPLKNAEAKETSEQEHISVDKKDISEKENATSKHKSYLTKSKVSKFMKRNPRKSLLKPYKTDESSISSSQSFISASQSFVEELHSDCSEDIQLRLTNSPVAEKVNFSNLFDFGSTNKRTINLASELANNKIKPVIREVDNDWLDRVCENTFGSVPNNNNNNNKNNNKSSFVCTTVNGTDARYNNNNDSNTNLIVDTDDTLNDDVISDSDDESKSPPLKKFKRAFEEYESTIILKPDEPLLKPVAPNRIPENSGDKIIDEKYKEYDFKETDEEPLESLRDKPNPKIKTRSQARASPPRKTTRSLNENYVKINLKKKTYSRGKKHMNFSKYKARQNAKLKREINEESDSLLPVEACEESPLCTIEEASEKRKTRTSTSRSSTRIKQVGEKSKKVEPESDNDEIVKEPGPEPIQPYYEDESRENVVHEALQKFGYKSFRTGQESAVRRILEGKSTLLTLSTGSGKSLCYMLPAYLYSRRGNCLTLVISPLVSLMDDQVANVPPFIKSACFHSNQTSVQREKVKELIASGKLSILFVSPELILSEEHSSGYKSIFSVLPPIAFACVDEAHCVSQWSHNFRPSYLLLPKILKESLGVNAILGLTATATRATIESIKKHFGVADDGVISDTPVPDNLSLNVSKVSNTNKEEALLNLLSTDEFRSYESIIIYCTRRDECERVAKFLRVNLQSSSAPARNNRKRISEQAECYHAGLSSYKRRSIQNAFMSGNIRIVVATVAFGMGINKSNIRSVIHYNLPKNIESYVQEIGRAGRDQQQSSCYVFLDQQGKDKYELRRHIYEDSVDRSTIKKLLKKIFIPCDCGSICRKHEVCFSINETVQDLDLPETNISTILCYLELDESTNVNLLSPGYVDCKITYPSVAKLEEASKHYEPLARVMKLYRENVTKNVFEFPAVAAASSLNLMSNIFKNRLKNLEWVAGKRSPINVQFSNLGFRLSSPGNLPESELDEILDSIHKKATEKEKTSMLQLETVHSLLLEAVTKEPGSRSGFLKERIREYFECEDPFEKVAGALKDVDEDVDEEGLIGDVRSLVCSHREVAFNGRSVARIFHGIQSPNFPALSWWRSRFWRSHVETDFHAISKIASAEILKL